MHTSLLSNSLLILFLTFSRIFLYFSNNSSSFIEKNICLVSWKPLLYALSSGRNTHKNIFVTNKIFKNLFTKRDLIRYDYFINIYNLYWNKAFMRWKLCCSSLVSPNFITYLSVFIYTFKRFCDFLQLIISHYFCLDENLQ